MQLLCRLPIGIYSDLMSLRKPFIILGMFASTLSCVIFSLTDHLGWILAARCLAGLAAASWVAFTVLYSNYFSSSEVHKAMGSISLMVVLAQLLGMSFSGFIVSQWGWHAPFWIGAAASIAGVILSFFISESKETESRVPLKIKDLTTVMAEPSLLKISLLSILAHSIIFSTMFGFLPTYALAVSLKASDISLLVFSFMIPHALAALVMGKVIVPYFGKWRSLKIAFLLSSVFTISIPLVETKAVLLATQAINGFALGITFPLLLGMAVEAVPKEKRATAMGAYQSIYAIGIFVGPFIAGLLNSEIGLDAGFYFTGLLGMIATVLLVIWSKGEVKSAALSLHK
jgi:MFS transporter, DHA1 family, multidrug resistance protein